MPDQRPAMGGQTEDNWGQSFNVKLEDRGVEDLFESTYRRNGEQGVGSYLYAKVVAWTPRRKKS